MVPHVPTTLVVFQPKVLTKDSRLKATGIPPFLLGIVTWFFLADSPETAHYLTAEEKQLMITRRNWELGQTASAQEFHKEDLFHGLKDWKIWAFCMAQFGADTVLYGFITFLPTIIKGINSKW